MPSVRRTIFGCISPKRHSRAVSDVTTGSSGAETPPPMYRSPPTSPAGAAPQADSSQLSIVEQEQVAVTHVALATALQKVSGPSSPTVGLDSKAARHGYALLDLAAREQRCPDTDEELRRRLYIDGVGYLLRSLPESLTFEEEVALRAALPNCLAGNSIRSEQSGLQDRSHPRQTTTRKPLLHRAAATSALYTILALSVVIPCVQSVCSQAYTIDRRHKISDRLIASATAVAQSTTTQMLALAAVVWDLNDGRLRRAVGDLGVWLARDLSGGAHEGVMEAIGRLKLEGENGRSS
ncbi:hypothetical protein B0A48_08465 [Cryoendolithus antarcticus]|uniref:Uncharacterized protein n=1 Tax=Cryoendolithus antarcticus TaxID=1507870 RepID=A0A1V8T613_9PEZI|nr:hypothetical protein B0A48_08465 [Cryoendolithus antarcticus]